MAHDYSLQIHSYINERLTIVMEKKKEALKERDVETQKFYEGQEKELLTLRKYLIEQIDLTTRPSY